MYEGVNPSFGNVVVERLTWEGARVSDAPSLVRGEDRKACRVRVVEEWNRLPNCFVNSGNMAMFKGGLISSIPF